MREEVEARLRVLARRAGWASASPAVVAGGLVLACVAVAVALWRWWPSPAADVGAAGSSGFAAATSARAASRAATRSAAPPSATSGAATSESGQATLCVDVVGAVRHPGVYVLAAGSRVDGAVAIAGGASPDAATEAINLAAKVADGEQIVVPSREQVAKGEVPAASSGPTGVASGGAGTAGSAGPPAKVNLNTADATALDSLPGVGPSTAAKIVSDRQTNGPFKSVDDLGRVPGIGPKKLDSLKDLVVVR